MTKAWINRILAAIVFFAMSNVHATQTFQRGDYAFTVASTPDWVQPRSVAATWDPQAPGLAGERWRYWLVDFQADRRAGVRVRYYDMAYEAVTSELAGDAAKFETDFFPEFQRLTFYEVSVRREGVWQDHLDPKRVTMARRETSFEQDMTTGAISALLVLDDIRAGDVVRVRYGIEGENPVLAGLDDERASFATTSVMLDRSMRILFDKDAKIAIRRLDSAPEPVEKKSEGLHELQLSVHGIAAFHDEGVYPVWYWRVPQLVVSENRTWADVAAWARTLYPPYKTLPPDLEQRIVGWKRLPSVDDRISAALRAVQEEVRYFGTEIGENSHRPAEPAEAWTKRYGDCKDKARLLAAILDRLGIEAYPAIVLATHTKGVADLPPAASAFDHVIVQVKLAGESIWLDPTATQQRGLIRKLDRLDFGVALPVASGTHDLVNVSAPTAIDRVSGVERYTPAADGKIVLDVETRYAGNAAEQLRRSLRVHNKDELDRRYADFYRKRYGDVEIKTPVEIRELDAEDSVVIHSSYALVSAWEHNTSSSRVIDMYADLIAERVGLPKTMVRTAPLAIAHPADVEQTVEMQFPTGWHWLGKDEKKTIENAFVHYEKDVHVSGNIVRNIQHYTSREDALDIKEANSHIQRLRELNDALNQRMAFAQSEPDDQKQRRQRLENALRNIMDKQQDDNHAPAHH